MANSAEIAELVIYLTVLAQKLAQYPAGKCRGKTMQVLGLGFIQKNTSSHPPDRYQFVPVLRTAARNTLLLQDLAGRILSDSSTESRLPKICTSRRWFRNARTDAKQA
jgi:hypothetical protein